MLYQNLNGAKDIQALQVGVGDEGCRDGEHLQCGEEVVRDRCSPGNVHVHASTQVAHQIQEVCIVGSIAEKHQSYKEYFDKYENFV
jgi:hypothetical protein